MVRNQIEDKPSINEDVISNPKAYKHHRVGEFNCESEVIEKGILVCCLHNPITGEWKFPPKSDK